MDIKIEKINDNKYEFIVDTNNDIKTIYNLTYKELYQLHIKIVDIVNQQENKYNQ
jgi:hypothetical protein